MRSAVGVIGTGAMGLGVVQSLTRAGFAVYARDIRAEACVAVARSKLNRMDSISSTRMPMLPEPMRWK